MEIIHGDCHWQEKNDLPLDRVFIPRYTIPIVAALIVAFPTETRKENIFSVIERFSSFVPFAVALNEMSDIGVPADLRLLEGKAKQGQFLPLLQTRNFLSRELDRRMDNFVEAFPYLKETVRVMRDDFLFLAKNRECFNPVTCLELDSGIFEAGCMAVVFPNNDIFKKLEINFPGKACHDPNELLKKYELFVLPEENTLPSNHYREAAQELHALEMLMKMDDDIKGTPFDRQVGIPNYHLWAESLSETTGEPVSKILKRTKGKYLHLASENLAQEIINRSIVLALHFSGKLKDFLAINGIQPVDDLYQLPILCQRFFGLASTALRHQLEATTLLSVFDD